MRRSVGLGAIHKQQMKDARFKEKSNEIAKEQLDKLSEQMDVFRSHLQTFAAKHKKAIRKNGEFRRQFQEMCATAGVDPLQSSNTFWSKLLGVGDFYYELAVQIVEVCMATSKYNGGIITIEDLLSKVRASRKSLPNKSEEITTDDLLRAISKLSVLGNGLKVLRFEKSIIVQSVGNELSMDHNSVIQLAQSNSGHVDVETIKAKLNWSEHRAVKILNDMIMEGIVWIDDQTPDRTVWYWLPGLSL